MIVIVGAYFVYQSTQKSQPINKQEIKVKKEFQKSCQTDSDCVIKDVRNCCGYYPRCVNKDYIPDIISVEKKCRENNLTSVCGWPDISHCECTNNTCTSMQGKDKI